MNNKRRILFLWDQKLDHMGMKNGICFSGKYQVQFDRKKKELIMKENSGYIDGFWGENIVDCIAVVGEDRAGKTSVIHTLMNRMNNLDRNEKIQECVILMEEEGVVFAYEWKQEEEIIKTIQNDTKTEIKKQRGQEIRWKMAYFHDLFNLDDYKNHEKCAFDFSVGREIKRIAEEKKIRHSDVVEEYFCNQDQCIRRFLRNVKDQNIRIPFPIQDERIQDCRFPTEEQQFLSLFSRLYSMKDQVESVFLIFDEVDFNMHPKWQRMYMKWITEFCDQIFNGSSVQILLTTHSPMLLSDFPSNSVLYLSKDQKDKIEIRKNERKKTFGADLNTLALDAFSLEKDGIIGAFAEKKINETAAWICVEDSCEKEEQIEKLLNYIGGDLIRENLKDRWSKKRKSRKNYQATLQEQEVMEDAIRKLEEQKRTLEVLLDNFREKLYDKN